MTAVVDAGELELVRDTAAQIAKRCRKNQTGPSADHAACWDAVRAAGLTDLRAADSDGSAGGSMAMTTAVVEELARSVCGAPLVGHLLATELLRLTGAELADDERPLTVVLDQSWQRLDDTATGVGWDAALAARALAAGADALVICELDQLVANADGTRPTRALAAADPVALTELAPAQLEAFSSFARTILAADLLGAAGGIFDDCVRYAQDRVQFGVPIGSFQAVQHLCAQAYVQLEGLRSTLLFAVRALDSGSPSVQVRTSLVAKSFANEAAVEVVQTAMQVFGGISITSEHSAHRHLRRVLVDRETLGTSELLDDQLLNWVEA